MAAWGSFISLLKALSASGESTCFACHFAFAMKRSCQSQKRELAFFLLMHVLDDLCIKHEHLASTSSFG